MNTRQEAISAVVQRLQDLQGTHQLEHDAILLGATGDPKYAVAEMVVNLLPHDDWTLEDIRDNPRQALEFTAYINDVREEADNADKIFSDDE